MYLLMVAPRRPPTAPMSMKGMSSKSFHCTRSKEPKHAAGASERKQSVQRERRGDQLASARGASTAAGSRQQAAGGRQQAAGSRQQAAGSRQQAAGSIKEMSMACNVRGDVPSSMTRTVTCGVTCPRA